MKILKMFLKVVMTGIAWIGILCIIFSIFGYAQRIYYLYNWHTLVPGSVVKHITGYTWVGIIGVILAIFGGLITRPLLFWQVLVACGVASILLALYGISMEKIGSQPIFIIFKYISIFLLPGAACIIEGLVIRWLRRKQVKARFA